MIIWYLFGELVVAINIVSTIYSNVHSGLKLYNKHDLKITMSIETEINVKENEYTRIIASGDEANPVVSIDFLPD